MKLRLSDRVSGLALLFIIICGVCPARAQTVVETQPLSFGKIAIQSGAAVARITITTAGGYTTNGRIYVIDPPTRGEYDLTGGPPNSPYTITLPASVNLTGPGGPFTLDNLVVRPTTLQTNASGDDSFRITGRLRTLGGGTPYGDGAYSGTVTITINF